MTQITSEPGEESLNFSNLQLHEKISKAIEHIGYTQATTIQQKAIPVILNGSDILASAQTGSGKTVAFSIPIIQSLMDHASESTSPAKHPLKALILAPTRELAQQIHKVIVDLTKFTPLNIALLLGGEPILAQKKSLQKGADIVIATPGRLLDHINMCSIALGQVKILTLDEADKMLDMGFLPDLERIFTYLPPKRQTLLFSATFSTHIKKLASQYQTNPITIEAHSTNSSNTNVSQLLYLVDEQHKFNLLKSILAEKTGQCIIFTNSKIDCKKLHQQLYKDYNAATIHGDMSQIQRLENLQTFKDNKARVLVATDVAARGLDIAGMPLVINYHLPWQAQDYIHRIGRTGRAGQTGEAISFYTTKENKFKVDIEKLIGKDMIKFEQYQYKAPVLQPRYLQQKNDEYSAGAKNISSNDIVDDNFINKANNYANWKSQYIDKYRVTRKFPTCALFKFK
jgi:ATP-dependent RNA helicase RhlE